MATVLITDEPDVAGLRWLPISPNSCCVETRRRGSRRLTMSPRRKLARLFGTASDWLATAARAVLPVGPRRGMAGAVGCAVGAARSQFADEDDPPPPHLVALPDCRLPDDFDPDELLGIKHAYAGQVALLDNCLGAFLRELARIRVARGHAVDVCSRLAAFRWASICRVGACDERCTTNCADSSG